MKSNLNKNIFLVFTMFNSAFAMAQNGGINIPPEVSPMPMKPEMTEIWNPEINVVIPAKKIGNAPSDAIILFDGKF